jgi:lambda family phage portal protein
MNAPLTLNGNGARVPKGTLLDADGQVMSSRAPSVEAHSLLYGTSGTGYGQYGANLSKNSLLGWLWRGGDADLDIGWNVQILRERSRDAFMGIPLAAGAIEALDSNVIGEGLYPAPNVDGDALGLDEAGTAALNKELADKFEWWATDPRESDYEAKHSFYTLQHVAYQSMLLSGDCPALFPLLQRPNTMFDFRVRILEGDRIMNPPTFVPSLDTNIFNGVELNKNGELVAYHIAEYHPLAFFRWPRVLTGRTFRVEPFGAQSGRRNMVLLIRPERPEQRRGVPILAVCLELLKQLGRYTDATVLGAVIQSYFTAFITADFPDPNIFESLLTDEQKAEILNFNSYNVQLGPGIVNFMRPGHEVKFASPTQPTATFGEFTIAVAKFIGSALGIPYEVLLKQYNASYSASRAALLDFWKRVRKWRGLVVDQFCQPVYEEWLTDAISLGRIVNFKGGFDDPLIRRAMLRCIWTGTSAGSLDPQKEVAAADMKVKCGFSTIERESAELNGSNYSDNIRQQSREQTEFEEAELIFPPYRPTRVDVSEPQTKGGESKKVPIAPTTNRAALASGLSGRFSR